MFNQLPSPVTLSIWKRIAAFLCFLAVFSALIAPGTKAVPTRPSCVTGGQRAFKHRADLAVGDTQLFNQYGVMVVNPAKHPQAKAVEAQKFVDWVTSSVGQSVIAGYKIGGEQLFFPNAGK